MDSTPADDFEASSAGLRVVIASPLGIAEDRRDIKTVRVGHAAGFSLFTAATEPGQWQFAVCGIEWLCLDGRIERRTAAQAKVEVLEPGLIAFACLPLGPQAGESTD